MIFKKKKNNDEVIEVFTKFLNRHNHRKTPERFSILNEVYSIEGHFDIDSLYEKMNKKNYRVSRATLYNTIELLLDCKLVRKHQFGTAQAQYEKSYFDNQHDHIILTDSGEVKEFCDPRIQTIKKNTISIKRHQLQKLYSRSPSHTSFWFAGRCRPSKKNK